jgi:hypothetical protein
MLPREVSPKAIKIWEEGLLVDAEAVKGPLHRAAFLTWNTNSPERGAVDYLIERFLKISPYREKGRLDCRPVLVKVW